jgi:putative transposase
MRYRQANVTGGKYFSTVNQAERQQTILVDHMDVLRMVMKKVQAVHACWNDSMMILPDHMHAMWTLPESDVDYPTRRALINAGFSCRWPKDDQRNQSHNAKGER